MKNEKFVYDEKTSTLYAPDGTFLKKLFCTKAKRWNQLLIEPGEARWRGCEDCKEKVFDLNGLSVDIALDLLKSKWTNACVYVSSDSQNVIFLEDVNAIKMVETNAKEGPIKIQTVYGKADISRGWSMGYWPDVRIIKSDAKLNSKITVGQHPETGEIVYSHDLRMTFREGSDDDKESTSRGIKELHPFVSYYPYQREEPIAAYLVPKGLSNGTRVVVVDPIEIFLKTTWNQGGGWRARDVPGHIENNKVIVEFDKIKVSHAIG